MFLRHTTVRRGRKTHVYWKLVRSVRVNGKVRQEVVANLGQLDGRGRMRARHLADKITGKRCDPSLFEPDDVDDSETAQIELRKLRVERSRRFGDVYLALVLWRSLQLDRLFDELIAAGREDVRWSTLAAIHVILRLCSPSSDLALAEDVYRKTALEDLLGVPAEKINDDRVYRALDKLLPHKPAVEQHLRARLGELFAIDYDLLLYDVTSTYFEGTGESNPQAKRGYSRDHRPDCKQVCIALVVTRDGIPLSYEVFDGNTVDVTTVEKIVTTIETRFGAADRVWVMDRGMVSEKNVAWLRGGGRRYLIGASKSELGRMQQRIVEDADWTRSAYRRTSSFASSRTCCGRRSSNGRDARAWATQRAPCWPNSRRSNPWMSSCPRPMHVNCACDAWSNQRRPRRCFSNASACDYPAVWPVGKLR